MVLQNIALLRKCGIPDWILVDDDWKEFIVYFKEYISEANILTDEELIELVHQTILYIINL